MTGDGLSVKISVRYQWRIVDPLLFAERSADPLEVVQLAVQVGLRECVVGQQAQQLADGSRTALGSAVAHLAHVRAGEVGVALDEVVVKDVVLPAEYRAAAAQVLIGRQRAQAQLEAARAQTAAIRSLANAAQLLDAHPALAQLRLVESLPSGSTVELVMPSPSRSSP